MNFLIFSLFAAFFFKGVFWVAITPVFQAPDEPNHFAYTQFLAETGKFAVGKQDLILSREVVKAANFLNLDLKGQHPIWKPDFSGTSFGKNEAEIEKIPTDDRKDFFTWIGGGRHPPFYYLISGIFYRSAAFGSLIDRVFFIRFFSVLLGTASVLLTFLLARELFGKNYLLAITTSVIVAFHPTFNVSSSTITPDILAIFLTGVFSLFGVKILKETKVDFKNIFFFFTALILGILTRFTNFALIPVSVIPLLKRKILLLVLLLIGATGIFLVFLRSPGMLGEFGQFFGKPSNLAPISFFNFVTNSFSHYYSEVFSWYWAVFGWLEASLPLTVYRVLRVLTILSILGLLIHLVSWLRKPSFNKNSAIWFFLIAVIGVTAAGVIIFDWQTFVRTGVGFGIQGRHFLMPISAQIIFFVIGITIFLSKFKIPEKIILVSLTSWFIFLNFLAIWVQIYFFYQTTNFSQFIARASQYKPDFFRDGWLVFWLGIFLLSQIIFAVQFIYEITRSED